MHQHWIGLALLFSWFNICMLLAGSICVWSCWSIDQETWWTFLCVQLIISAWLVLESLLHSLSPFMTHFYIYGFDMYIWFWTENWFFVRLHNYLFSVLNVNVLMNATVGHIESWINKILVVYCFRSLHDKTIAGLLSKHNAVIAYYPSKSGVPQPSCRGAENSSTLLSFTSDSLCSLVLNHHKHSLLMPRSIPLG